MTDLSIQEARENVKVIPVAVVAAFLAVAIQSKMEPEVASAHTIKNRCQLQRCDNLRERMWNWYRNSGARCIREHEGAWHDPNAPYWGGFQADLSFQKTYGKSLTGTSYYRKWGVASHWPLFRQIHMAYRGWRARGWQPWPTTRRICGL